MSQPKPNPLFDPDMTARARSRRSGTSFIKAPLLSLAIAVTAIGFGALPSVADAAGKAASKTKRTVERHVGYASYYARRFSGRKMADGTPMRPESDNAASLTLPLGTKALVTNLKNGRTAVVTIRDRGPYIKGRIIDVSPGTARVLGMLHAGVVRVTVHPLRDGDLLGDTAVALAEAEPANPTRP